MSTLLFCIDNSLGKESNYLKIYDDRVVTLQPKGSVHTKLDFIKKELQLQGYNTEKFFGIDIALRKIDHVYYCPPKSIALQGYMMFHIKYTEFKVPHLWNHKSMSNCFTVFWQNIGEAERIVEYLKKTYPEITIEKV